MDSVVSIIIIVVWLFHGILIYLTYSKMINILVKNNMGDWWYCWWKLQFSYRFFKKFIIESNLDSSHKEKHLLLYRRGIYARRGLFLYFFLLITYIFLFAW